MCVRMCVYIYIYIYIYIYETRSGQGGFLGTVFYGSPDHRITGPPDHRIAGSPDRRIAGSPDHRITGSPDRRIASQLCGRRRSGPVVPGSSRNRRSQIRSRPLPLLVRPCVAVADLSQGQGAPAGPRKSQDAAGQSAQKPTPVWPCGPGVVSQSAVSGSTAAAAARDRGITGPTVPEGPRKSHDVPGGPGRPRPVSSAADPCLAQWSRRRLATSGLRFDPGRADAVRYGVVRCGACGFVWNDAVRPPKP